MGRHEFGRKKSENIARWNLFFPPAARRNLQTPNEIDPTYCPWRYQIFKILDRKSTPKPLKIRSFSFVKILIPWPLSQIGSMQEYSFNPFGDFPRCLTSFSSALPERFSPTFPVPYRIPPRPASKSGSATNSLLGFGYSGIQSFSKRREPSKTPAKRRLFSNSHQRQAFPQNLSNSLILQNGNCGQ